MFLSGAPIDEPLVHYGPFVMNSVDEINQAIDDFNSRRVRPASQLNPTTSRRRLAS